MNEREELEKARMALAQKDDQKADALLQGLIRKRPRYFEAWMMMAQLAQHRGDGKAALVALRRALPLQSQQSGRVHYAMAQAYQLSGRWEEALTCCEKAATSVDTHADIWLGWTALLLYCAKYAEALGVVDRALLRWSWHAGLHANRAIALKQMNRWHEALEAATEACRLNPSDLIYLRNQALLAQEIGAHSRAQQLFQKILQRNPADLSCISSMLFGLNYDLELSAEAHCTTARYWGRQLQSMAEAEAPVFEQWDALEDTELVRIGFVSGDLRAHPVGYFMLDFLRSLRILQGFRLSAYVTAPCQDSLANQIRALFDEWVDVDGCSDRQIAERIHQDAIQVLVDLSGHTRYNRIRMFCWKPAPLQVSWLGYFATTGLTCMDFILVDHHVVPQNDTHAFVEQPIHLPNTYRCFSVPMNDEPVASLPALRQSRFTFGCFNHLNKLNPAVLHVWGTILKANPSTRLLLKARQLTDSHDQQQFRQVLADAGLPLDRVLLEGVSSYADYLASYAKVDLALDPFPYTGATVSMEGLWMGVPVLSRVGASMLSRSGVNLLANLNMHEFLADSDDAYIAKALYWTENTVRLAEIRQGLRQRLNESPLLDPDTLSRNWLEQLRLLWKQRRAQSPKVLA